MQVFGEENFWLAGEGPCLIQKHEIVDWGLHLRKLTGSLGGWITELG